MDGNIFQGHGYMDEPEDWYGFGDEDASTPPEVPLDIDEQSFTAADLLRLCQSDVDRFLNFSSVEQMGDVELTEAVTAVERLAWQVQSLQIVVAGEVDTRTRNRPTTESLALTRGCRTAVDLLQKATLISRREAGQRIRLAQNTRDEVSLTGAPVEARFPVVAQAIRTAAIPVDTGRVIVNTLVKLRHSPQELLDAAERNLVEAATGLDFGTGTLAEIAESGALEEESNLLRPLSERGLLDPLISGETGLPPQAEPALARDRDAVGVLCDVWTQAIDQDGPRPTDEEKLIKRGIRLGRMKDGLIPLSGLLAPEVAAAFSNLSDAINAPRNQRANGEKEDTEASDPSAVLQGQIEDMKAFTERWSGEENLSDWEGRTQDQKRHDAFAMMIGVAASSSDVPQHGGAPVTVLVQTTEERLRGRESAWIHGPSSYVNLLTPQATEHLVCSGALQYYAQNAAGRITALGTKQRIYNAGQRRAIVARDGGCVIPGCSTPPSWCEIHHVHPHAEGGRTHVDNGVALCWFHHRTLETSGWEIKMRDGVPFVRSPEWLDPSKSWVRAKAVTERPNATFSKRGRPASTGAQDPTDGAPPDAGPASEADPPKEPSG